VNCCRPQLAELGEKFMNVGIGNTEIKVRNDEFAGARFACNSTSLGSVILKKMTQVEIQK
jgi:hypothetical protein